MGGSASSSHFADVSAQQQSATALSSPPKKPATLVDRLRAKIGPKWQVPIAEIKLGRLLGKGSQGEVYLGEWRGSMIAVKKIDMTKVEEQILEEFCSEAEIMHRLRHPSLAMFMGICLEPPHLCILTELVPRGAVFDLLQDEHVPISWNLILRMSQDIAEGMAYLHAFKPQPVLHRDLKSLNLLVDENWRCKIIDFGMTRFADLNANMTQCGSPLWMAPEMIKNETYDDRIDVYSFGVVMWELVRAEQNRLLHQAPCIFGSIIFIFTFRWFLCDAVVVALPLIRHSHSTLAACPTSASSLIPTSSSCVSSMIICDRPSPSTARRRSPS